MTAAADAIELIRALLEEGPAAVQDRVATMAADEKDWFLRVLPVMVVAALQQRPCNGTEAMHEELDRWTDAVQGDATGARAQPMSLGQAVVLTGPMGVGKTTIGRAVQRRMTSPWILWEPDRRQPSLPPDRPDLATVEIDRRMRIANLAAARAYCDSGFDAIIEQDLSDHWMRTQVPVVLAGIRAPIVVLMCSAETQAARLDERGDSPASREWARTHHQAGWSHVDAVLSLQTDGRSPDDLADEIAALLAAG